MPLSENLSDFFNESDFAHDATWTPAAGGGPFTIQVIFDNEFEEHDIGQAGQDGRTPMCSVRESQIEQAAGMVRDDPITINGVGYTVVRVDNTDPGVARVVLRTT